MRLKGADAVRKRAATRGEVIVEMKKDEAITGLSVAWTVERYVKVGKVVEEKESKTKEESAALRLSKGGKKAGKTKKTPVTKKAVSTKKK